MYLHPYSVILYTIEWEMYGAIENMGYAGVCCSHTGSGLVTIAWWNATKKCGDSYESPLIHHLLYNLPL